MATALLLADTPSDLTRYFAAVAHQPWALLFDSAAPSHVNSRFHLLLAQPVATLICRDGELTLNKNGQQSQFQADPFATLQQLHQEYFPKPVAPAQQPHLPFAGGLAGFFGYELGQLLEPVPEVAAPERALPDLAVGLYLWALVLDQQRGELWYLDASGDAKQSWPERKKLFDGSVTTTEFSLSSDWTANMDKASYSDKFNRVQQYLKSGDCYQINLAQRFSARYQGDEWQAYLKLRAKNAAPFSAFMRVPQGAVLSLSPERFIEVKQGRVETKPIKGTLPRSADPVQDAANAQELQQSEKNRAENVMIVDLLRNDLGKHCVPGSVKVPSLFAIESFPAVHHLVSTVTGELNPSADAFDLLRGAFPGGSITGAPKVRAMQIIAELEPHPRSVYCGAIGYINQHGDMDTNIAIRTLVLAGGEALCWAGGGLVADSEAASEYQETFDKVQRILPVLSEQP
ncbi:aminodeoxychorismate synthase component I [Rheinheimera marina]|uniref:aminodeoxychorismate synthase n=1 Tax=Rheinheimera marina TaxID=1774958 RepID=A0ABV9JQ18_9GAMM